MLDFCTPSALSAAWSLLVVVGARLNLKSPSCTSCRQMVSVVGLWPCDVGPHPDLDSECSGSRPFHEHLKGLSLLLLDVHKCNVSQMVWLACCELRVWLRLQCFETVNGVRWESSEPAKGSSLQWGVKNSTQDYVVWGIQTHLSCINIHMLIEIGHPVVPIYI